MTTKKNFGYLPIITSSALGAAISTICTTPFDVARIRLQTDPKLSLEVKGLMNTFSHLAKNEGVGVLWRGLTPALMVSVSNTVIYFTAYERLKANTKSIKLFQDKPYLNPLFCGSVARWQSCCVVAPIELIRTLQQHSTGSSQSKDILYYVRKIQSRCPEYKCFWKGLVPTLWRDIPFSGIYWLGVEYLRPVIREKLEAHLPSESANITFATNFLAASISGSIAAVFTQPFDVIKTRQQVLVNQILSCHYPSISARQSTLKLFKDLYTEEGLNGVFQGLRPRVVKIAPACAIMLSSYELAKHFFGADSE